MRLVVGCCLVLIVIALLAAAVCAQEIVNGEILDYGKGYVVLTTGESYGLADAVQIIDAESGQPSSLKPLPGVFVRLTFDASGHVATLTVARSAKAIALVKPPTSFAHVTVPLGPPVPAKPQGEFVPVAFVVVVPSTTLPGDQVYMSTSETSWMPTAVRMDRVDARHFRVIIDVPVGTTFLYLYTRGSPQSLERDANGLQRTARTLTLATGAAQAVHDAIEHWGDELGTSLLPPPQTFPTPYNPAPFPNLPPSPRP